MTTAQQDVRVELRRTIAAPREAVFEAWTRPEVMSKWYAAGDARNGVVESDPRPGGRYRVEMILPDGKSLFVGGEYLEVIPNSKIVFTWKWDHDTEVSRVTVALKASGENTEMLLTHERLNSVASRDGHAMGWESCMTKLAAALGG